MKKYYLIIFFSVLVFFSFSLNQDTKPFNNLSFVNALDDYCKYIDTMGYKKNFDFIYLEAFKKEDCIKFELYLWGGAYPLINGKENIIDFIPYKGYELLLVGNFPNEVLNIEKNKEFYVWEDIVKKRYRQDYDKYIQEKFMPAPLIYDYMKMTLIFKKNKLIVYKKEFF